MACGHANDLHAEITKCPLAISTMNVCTGTRLEYTINPPSRWKCRNCAWPFEGDYEDLTKRNFGMAYPCRVDVGEERMDVLEEGAWLDEEDEIRESEGKHLIAPLLIIVEKLIQFSFQSFLF
jgi:hypothetical protein